MKFLSIQFFLIILFTSCTSSKNDSDKEISSDMISTVDHLVYATPDLNQGVEEIEKLIGIKASPGGQHLGIGTRNALVSLGPKTYLEIIAPDPEQGEPEEPRPFDIDNLQNSKLAAWYIYKNNLANFRNEAVRNGVPLGEVISGSRKRPDDILLSWQMTYPSATVGNGLIPFFIDWGNSPHPATTAAQKATLIGLRVEHPDPASIQRMFELLGITLKVKPGSEARIIAVVEGKKGQVELK